MKPFGLHKTKLHCYFDKAKSTISEHIKHIFEEGELEEKSVVRKFRTTAIDGKKNKNTTELHSVRNVTLGKKNKITTELHSVRNAS